MLKHLRIANLVLVEFVEISFEKGLNILSGETGAGKSAILQAIALILGGRADSGLIRKQADKGFVEALFEVQHSPHVHTLLVDAGIDHSHEEDLLIRREITLNGKNRIFINNQLASLSLIEKIGEQLTDLVSQHSHQKLLSLHYQLHVIDLFAKTEALKEKVKQGWEQESLLKQQLDQLLQGESTRLRDIDRYQMELEELRETPQDEDEEEILFNEYSRLSHADELHSKVQEVVSSFNSNKSSILPLLNRQKNLLENLTSLDPTLQEPLESISALLLEAEEISLTLSHYLSRIESHPERLNEVDLRLNTITRLKRKYGKTIEEILAYKKEISERIEELRQSDVRIETLTNQIRSIENTNLELCQHLSRQRSKAAKELENALSHQLRELNMPRAQFHIQITLQSRTASGIDHAEFFFTPNVGEPSILLRECASGGELSRILLALKTVLAGKDKVPILIFDEIDANLGGETAAIVGDKLNIMGESHQIICITHLPQVAKKADCHFHIYKEEREGRTFTSVICLDKKRRQEELARMLGGNAFSAATKELAEKILEG